MTCVACTAHCAGFCHSNTCSTYSFENPINWNYNGSGLSAIPGCAANVNFPTSSNSTIHDENIERLRGSINDERSRRGLGIWSWNPPTMLGSGSPDNANPASGSVVTNGIIYTTVFYDLRNAINNIRDVVNIKYDSGKQIKYFDIYLLKYWIERLRGDCICNGDCGLNSVCSCHTYCGCNY